MFKKGSFEIGGTIYPVAIKVSQWITEATKAKVPRPVLVHDHPDVLSI